MTEADHHEQSSTATPAPEPEPVDLEPPSPNCGKLEKPFLLIAQTLYLVLIFIPVIVYDTVKSFFATPKPLKGKVVLVTGSGRGLGQGLAVKFAQLGCKVACVDINEAINQQTVQIINESRGGGGGGGGFAKSYTCNVGLSDQIRLLRERVVQDLGQVDILVHNAGLIAGTPSAADFDDLYVHGVITVNLTSHFFMIREFLPDMMKRNQGHIVAVSSIAGYMGIAKGSMYVATKHGVVGLMESLHYELQEIPNNKVKTSVICPYFINTSAFYSKNWHLRIPELSIDRVVKEAINGIRLNTRIITIPSHFYYVANICRLLPDRLTRIVRNIYYVRLQVPSMQDQKKLPLYKLLLKSFEKFKLVLDES